MSIFSCLKRSLTLITIALLVLATETMAQGKSVEAIWGISAGHPVHVTAIAVVDVGFRSSGIFPKLLPMGGGDSTSQLVRFWELLIGASDWPGFIIGGLALAQPRRPWATE